MNITMTYVFFPINESEIFSCLTIIEIHSEREEKHVHRNSQEKLCQTTPRTVTWTPNEQFESEMKSFL